MTIRWNDCGHDVHHAFDKHGFCGCVWKGKYGKWFPRTRDRMGHVVPLRAQETVDEAKRVLETYREGLGA